MIASAIQRVLLCALVLIILSACGSAPKQVETVDKAQAWSLYKVVRTDRSMITLFDPSDLVHHKNEPANWYLRDFAIADDLRSGRFAAVLTDRTGDFKVRLTTGELSAAEKAAAGPEAKMRLRVINHRLLLAGGDAWPSKDVDYRKFANDYRWIPFENGNYGVIITALNPAHGVGDYVFQMIKIDKLSVVKHAKALPQLIYGVEAGVVGLNAAGYAFNEQCNDVPSTAQWVPLATRTMPLPGSAMVAELSRSMHKWAMEQQKAGNNAAIPIILSRDTTPGSFGFYIKPSKWSDKQVKGDGPAFVKTMVRCAVQITDVVADPDNFKLKMTAIPTAADTLPSAYKKALLKNYLAWLTDNFDPAWRYREAQAKNSQDDASLILGILSHLQLSSKETEKLLPLSNAIRTEYLLERFEGWQK